MAKRNASKTSTTKKQKSDAPATVLAFGANADVDSAATVNNESARQDVQEQSAMYQSNESEPTTRQITFTKSDKPRKGSGVLFKAPGYAGAVRLPAGFFNEGAIPDSITLESDAFREPRVGRAKLTPEQRRALPKPTIAEKIAAQERRLQKLREKAAREQSAELSQTM